MPFILMYIIMGDACLGQHFSNMMGIIINKFGKGVMYFESSIVKNLDP